MHPDRQPPLGGLSRHKKAALLTLSYAHDFNMSTCAHANHLPHHLQQTVAAVDRHMALSHGDATEHTLLWEEENHHCRQLKHAVGHQDAAFRQMIKDMKRRVQEDLVPILRPCLLYTSDAADE